MCYQHINNMHDHDGREQNEILSLKIISGMIQVIGLQLKNVMLALVDFLL